MNSFYTNQELKKLGLKSFGNNVFISKKVSLYSVNTIQIGNNVRIDDFCILSGNITIGNNVHISAGSKLYGQGGIEFHNYSGCSANCIIYSGTDDFSGCYMVGSMAPDEFRNVITGKVEICEYAQLGANTIVMPGIIIAEGSATGALTFVNENLDPWSIYVGAPCRKIKARSKQLLKLSNTI